MASERRVKVGDVGYYRVRGEHYPARCIVDDVRQCCGRVDEVIIYTMHGWQDVVARTTNGCSSYDGSGWVSIERYLEAREDDRKRVAEAFNKKWPYPQVASDA